MEMLVDEVERLTKNDERGTKTKTKTKPPSNLPLYGEACRHRGQLYTLHPKP